MSASRTVRGQEMLAEAEASSIGREAYHGGVVTGRGSVIMRPQEQKLPALVSMSLGR